jgi:hypothetical protein
MPCYQNCNSGLLGCHPGESQDQGDCRMPVEDPDLSGGQVRQDDLSVYQIVCIKTNTGRRLVNLQNPLDASMPVPYDTSLFQPRVSYQSGPWKKSRYR